jgi:hypothetical protein
VKGGGSSGDLEALNLPGRMERVSWEAGLCASDHPHGCPRISKYKPNLRGM